ncbi:MAG: DUF3298 domain-containing protein [Treponema sp.]|nr:DUF3298 domain-containing protein [Treponema sp.]
MKKIIWTTITLALVLAFTSCQSTKKSSKYQIKTLKENKDRIVVEMEYPEFYAYPEINRVVGAYITSDYEKTLANMKENHETIDWDDDFFSENMHSEYNISCPEMIITESNISFIIDRYVYFAGAAHGGSEYVTFNYDIVSQSFKDITDIPWVGDLEKLSAYCTWALKEDLYDDGLYEDEWLEQGASATPENYSAFTYDGTTLTVYYQQYQVAPYAAGIPCVEFTEKEYRAFFDKQK